MRLGTLKFRLTLDAVILESCFYSACMAPYPLGRGHDAAHIHVAWMADISAALAAVAALQENRSARARNRLNPGPIGVWSQALVWQISASADDIFVYSTRIYGGCLRLFM